MIDLHLHTNHSDGTDTVEKLLQNAENKKLEIISSFLFSAFCNNCSTVSDPSE